MYIGVLPGGLKLLLHFGGLVRFALRFQALGQAKQRPAIVGILAQVFPIDRFRWAARTYGGQKRVLKPEAERQPVLRRWQMTIADVYLLDQPQGAADRVRRWAAAIRSEL